MEEKEEMENETLEEELKSVEDLLTEISWTLNIRGLSLVLSDLAGSLRNYEEARGMPPASVWDLLTEISKTFTKREVSLVLSNVADSLRTYEDASNET